GYILSTLSLKKYNYQVLNIFKKYKCQVKTLISYIVRQVYFLKSTNTNKKKAQRAFKSTITKLIFEFNIT
ncbi:hypothetical protein D3X57_20585, partial [Acinetobacter baumannii]